ncbi:heavy metal-associated isoprenylated plant protein 47-like [Salvia miltiorrhiza]|uniref:heavy metal-associated isoprenylated plant protein 47-like n=1 Tax=Salvia miltiorrhiza TaxID=226208 RepID=UPI0025AD6273|nr:heavy metal-associated isoprenylated plant protein 47-like [Salvia miltiorrhiza]
MTQKIVIGMSLCNDKCRSKALKVAVSVPGVESAAIVRGDKDQVVVMGDGVDSVELTRRLRKKMGHAELMSVEQTSAAAEAQAVVPPPYYGFPYYHHYQYQVREPVVPLGWPSG